MSLNIFTEDGKNFKEDFGGDGDLQRRIENFITRSNGNNIMWIIGEAGIGKTHSLKKSFKNFKEESEFWNQQSTNFTSSKTIIFIDGWNEFKKEQIAEIKKYISSSNSKIIITSWFTEKIDKNYDIYEMSNNVQIERILWCAGINASEENIQVLKTLNYRQILILLKNAKKEDIENNAWDSMQKAFENIINNLKVPPTPGGNNWKYFKNSYVINNKNFPFIKYSDLDTHWKNELIYNNIIQNRGGKYYINCEIFLVSIILRPFMSKDWTEWIDQVVISKSGKEWVSILIWYFSARKNQNAISYLFKKYNYLITASLVSNKIKSAQFGREIKFDISGIEFDKLYSLFDLLPNISDDDILEISTNRFRLNYKLGQHLPNDTCKSYTNDVRYSNFHLLMIAILLRIHTDLNDKENFEISRIISSINFNKMGFEKCYKLPFNKKIIPSAMLAALIMGAAEELKINIFTNSDEIFSYLEKWFWFKNREKNPKTSILKYESKINKELERIFGENKVKVEYKVDSLLYMTDKSSILESVPYALRKINDIYEGDKYKNKFLKPLITHVYLMYDGPNEINNIFEEHGEQIWKSQYGGSFPDYDLSGKVKSSRAIARFLSLMLEGVVMEVWNSESPHFVQYEDFNEECYRATQRIESIISKPLFLEETRIQDVYCASLIEINGEKYFPIKLFWEIEANGYNGLFMTGNNIQSFLPTQIDGLENHWWMSPNQPCAPFKGQFNINWDDFLFYFNKKNSNFAIYSKNQELKNRWFEFFAESVEKHNFITNDYKYAHSWIVINHERGAEYSQTLEFYRKNNGGDYEFINYLNEKEKEIFEKNNS